MLLTVKNTEKFGMNVSSKNLTKNNINIIQICKGLN